MILAPAIYAARRAAFSLPSFASWVTFLLLYNTLWPISLYVALEICKVRAMRRGDEARLACDEARGGRVRMTAHPLRAAAC